MNPASIELAIRKELRKECAQVTRELSALLGIELRDVQHYLQLALTGPDGTFDQAAVARELEQSGRQINQRIEERAQLRIGHIRDWLQQTFQRKMPHASALALASAAAASGQESTPAVTGRPLSKVPLEFSVPKIEFQLQRLLLRGFRDILPAGITVCAGVGGAVGGAKVAALLGVAKAGTLFGLAGGPLGAVIGGVVVGAAGFVVGDKARAVVRRRWEKALAHKQQRRLESTLKEQFSWLHRRGNLQIVTQIDRVYAQLDQQLHQAFAMAGRR